MRLIYFFNLLLVLVLLGVSFYLQLYKGVLPCPLCILQRIAMAGLGVIFLLGVFFSRQYWGRFFINISALLFSILGVLLASRQVWLQRFPTAQEGECSVSLQYMLQTFPLREVIQKVLQGGAECMQVGEQFLALNLAEWALLWFMVFFCMSFYFCLSNKKTTFRS